MTVETLYLYYYKLKNVKKIVFIISNEKKLSKPDRSVEQGTEHVSGLETEARGDW
jgi:hypothetical protein